MYKKSHYLPPQPYLQIRKNALVFYDLPQNRNYANNNFKDFNTYQGFTSSGAKKRIRRTVDILCQLSPPRKAINPVTNKKFTHALSFITLTISEKERKVQPLETNTTLLAPFIRTMRRKHNMITYIWKAEFQKNGQLHYHITTPSVIHYQYIKDTWNNLLSKEGLLSNYLKEFTGGFPNSTDIHSVYKRKDIVWYISKEISKNVQDKKTKGKVWDCSLNLRGVKFYSIIQPSTFAGIIDEKKLVRLESCSIYKMENAWKILRQSESNNYNEWRAKIISTGLW